MNIQPQNQRFIHCPDCDHRMLTVDVNSTEKLPKYIRCENCNEVSGQYRWVLKRYPDAIKDKPKVSIKRFRGYSRKFNKEDK